MNVQRSDCPALGVMYGTLLALPFWAVVAYYVLR
jgi:hypothetical protein